MQLHKVLDFLEYLKSTFLDIRDIKENDADVSAVCLKWYIAEARQIEQETPYSVSRGC